MRAVFLAPRVAAEEDRRQRLWPHREAEHFVASDRRLDALAQEPERRAVAGLLVALDELGVPAGRAGAVLEGGVAQRLADLRDLGGGEDIRDDELHDFVFPLVAG